MSALSDIIARLEKATGPDRDVDAHIALATGWLVLGTNIGPEWCDPNNRPAGLPAYTASLDAALRLVPEGWGGSVDVYPESYRRPDADGKRLKWGGAASISPDFGDIARLITACAKTPALALCIAALKAREASA